MYVRSVERLANYSTPNRRGELVILVIALLAAGALFNLSPEKFPADDGFFYLQVANNIVHGHGSTFHGITETNGYHPLWMIVCVAGSLISLGSKGALIHVVWTIQVALLIWGLVLYRRFDRSDRSDDDRLPIGESVLLLVFVGLGSLYLTEAFLHLVFLMGLLLYARRIEDQNLGKWFGLGVMAGLFVLSRLDGVFVGGSILLATVTVKQRWQVRPIAALIAGGLVVMIPYLAYNEFTMGHIAPISGVIKSSIASPGSGKFDFFGRFMGALTGLYLLLLLTILRKRRDRWLMIALAIGGLLHIANSALLQDGSGQWYWVTQYVISAMLLNDLYRWVPDRVRSMLGRGSLRTTIVLVLLLPTLGLSYLKLQTNFSLNFTLFKGVPLEVQRTDPSADLARRLDGLLAEQSAVMVYDTPGRLAYYASLRIVPSDGLMNDFDYGEELEELGTRRYLIDHEINFVLSPYADQKTFHRRQNSMEIHKDGEQITLTI